MNAAYAPQVHNAAGAARLVLVCEHASHRIPAEYDGLGLDAATLKSHIAWDPGAFDVAKQMAADLDAPLVHSAASRLLYDCNRPPEAESAIPLSSEDIPVPGNANLSAEARDARIRDYYLPFAQLLSEVMADQAPDALVTVHSFTPVFRGEARNVEIGILHEADSRLADRLLTKVEGYVTARNQPYGPEDGVTHTLQAHGIACGVANVMIEIRNDLIQTPEDCAAMGRKLSPWLAESLAELSEAAAR